MCCCCTPYHHCWPRCGSTSSSAAASRSPIVGGGGGCYVCYCWPEVHERNLARPRVATTTHYTYMHNIVHTATTNSEHLSGRDGVCMFSRVCGWDRCGRFPDLFFLNSNIILTLSEGLLLLYFYSYCSYYWFTTWRRLLFWAIYALFSRLQMRSEALRTKTIYILRYKITLTIWTGSRPLKGYTKYISSEIYK